ncbi:MAG: hypothetical protein ABI120_12745 [Gemmatimonadaceae bacterium]
MTLRILSIIGWICFALDAAFVVMLLVTRDAGSDAAGRGLSRGWGMILLPILLAAGGLLYWGTRGKSSFSTIFGTFMVALPFIVLAQGKVKQMRENANYLAQKREHGQFADVNLNAVATLIAAGDATALRALLASQKAAGIQLDYQQHDKAGATLLGYAVYVASDYSATPDKADVVEMLLRSGVPYAADALAADGNWLRDIAVGGIGVNRERLMELALDAGANPNARDRYDNFNFLLNYQLKLPQIKILVKHGADVHALKDNGYTTMLNATYFKQYPEALFYLEHGVDPDYVAPDSNIVAKELERAVKEYAAQSRPMEPGYDELVAALKARGSKHPERVGRALVARLQHSLSVIVP